VNGACLTVTEFDDDSFKVGLANETLKRTNLGKSVLTYEVGMDTEWRRKTQGWGLCKL
jgi:riboflavin synthase